MGLPLTRKEKPAKEKKVRRPSPITSGWTLIELVVVIGILAIVIGIALPALLSGKTDANRVRIDGNAKVLNEAVLRARLRDDPETIEGGNPAGILEGNDKIAVATYLIEQGLVRAH